MTGDQKNEALVFLMEKIVDDTLLGIDIDETDDDIGWWETGQGAAFGAERKALLKDRLRALIEGRA